MSVGSGVLVGERVLIRAALRYTLHPPLTGGGATIKNIRASPPPVRLFILGARAESSLPRDVWYQLAYMFPRVSFHLIFIGPESMANRDAEYPLPDRTHENPFGAVVERVSYHMKISTFVEYFHTLHSTAAFAPYDPYFDAFVLFHPGLGHPGSSAEWEQTLPMLLETKVPVIATGYTEADLTRDVDWVHEKCKGEFDVLLEPGDNRFKSMRWDINEYVVLVRGWWGWGSANGVIVPIRRMCRRGTRDCGFSGGRGMRLRRRRRRRRCKMGVGVCTIGVNSLRIEEGREDTGRLYTV